MPALKLLINLVLYYAVMAALLLIVLWLYPPMQHFLPIGRVQALLAQAGSIEAPVEGFAQLAQVKTPLAHMPTFVGSLVWLGVAIIGALLAAVPVSWVYMNVRNPSDYDQSLVDTIVMLPMVVTSIVIIVQHSLALAFSLAGIAGAARYRNTLKSSGDLLFVLLSIGIGLSAGIGAVELAILSSAAFNFGFVALWFTNYGERTDMKRFLGEFERSPGNAASGGVMNGGLAKTRKARAMAQTIPIGLEDDAPRDRKMKQSDWDAL